jgi:hypothetical protein
MLDLRSSPAHRTVLLAAVAFLFAACASIPAEAPELSGELGQRLQAIEDAHLSLLHRFMDERRARVNDFIDKEWTPTFAEEFFSDPDMQAAWEEVVASGSAQDRSGYLLNVAPALIEEINAKRRGMLLPLDELEQELERRLRDEYAQAKSINNALTSFLASASDVESSRREYLMKAGIDEGALRALVTDVDTTVDSLVNRKAQAVSAYQSAADYLQRMKEILKSVHDSGGN